MFQTRYMSRIEIIIDASNSFHWCQCKNIYFEIYTWLIMYLCKIHTITIYIHQIRISTN
jgi:hypothetical protein